MDGDAMVLQHHHRPVQPTGHETFWFAVAIAIIAAFGFLLWLVIWLSNTNGPTSDHPNPQPHAMAYVALHDIDHLLR